MKPAVTKLTGISHFFAAAGYSLGGFGRLIKEAAFRQGFYSPSWRLSCSGGGF